MTGENDVPSLMISISGVRGIYGDGLDDELAMKFGCAFGRLYGGPVVVGRDSRVSGPAVSRAVVRGLRMGGADVIDLGLASTPTTEMAVPARGACGGIIITASHNPREWNGLKFLDGDGVFLDAEAGGRLLAAYRSIDTLDGLDETGGIGTWNGADDHHIESILSLPFIDREAIAPSCFTVCLDAVRGAGGVIGSELLRRLGCTVHGVDLDPDGEFPRNPEPLPENLKGLENKVRETGADVGFALDPDVDRLAIVDDFGAAIGEEYTLALAVDFMMEHTETDTACNLSTSRMLDDVAAHHGRTVHRSAIGEINVVTLMKETGVEIGGEGNGGVIVPRLHYGRDAVLGMALILQVMAERSMSIDELISDIPSYVMRKEKLPLPGGGDWKSLVLDTFPDAETDTRDGVKVIFPDSWVHVRESNTEPIVRIYAEAPDRERVDGLVRRMKDVFAG